ncbi:MAG: TonB-dependent receptor [Olivibacter sp.]|nr:TonB-dependent receptor [Olivibacter sp. UJ_SKK_5.1]
MSIKPKIQLNLLGVIFVIYSLLSTGKVYAEKLNNFEELPKQENIFFGAVRDTANLPLQGVSVYVKGNPKVGTTTDEKGQFRLPTTESNVTLVFRYVGYQVRELTNPSKSAINITLQPDESQLSEVVIVGYGTQKKESVTGAISTVSSNDLSRSVATTTSGALVGKIAGVNSRMPDGRPGAATNISIRNMGNPLYVIDGVQKDAGQFNNLDFNDIESISVLKDASAAIYGVRAANGVIVVTTKKGKRGDNNSFNINSYYGLQHMFRYPKPADISTYISSYIQSDAITGAADPLYTKEDLAKWQQGTEKGYRPFDWYDYILKTSPQAYISGNASGGSEKINYYLGLSHLSQESVIQNYGGFYRTNVQMNLEASVSKKLKIGGNLNGRIEKRRQPGVPGGDDTWQALFATYRNLPTARPFANDNPLYPARTSANTETNFAMLNYDLSGEYQEVWRVMQLNFNAEYELTPNLKARGIVGYYLANKWMDNQEYTYKLYGYDEATDTYPVVFSMDNPWRERSIERVEEITTQFTLTYNKRFGKHGLNVLGAAETIKRDNPDVYVHDRPASNELSLIYFPTLDTYNDTGINTEARAGFAGRINYDYDQKYLLEIAARYDGSWKFPPNHRWGLFPSVSGGWRISSENFWKDSRIGKVFSDLKLRASYGLLGDDALEDDWGYHAFDFLSGYTYNNGGSALDGKYVTGTNPRGLAVTTLSWIRAHMFDVGLDFALFNGKLSGSVDYFRRKRTGLPASRYDVLIPGEAGFSLPYENLNSDVHTGVDGSVVWRSNINQLNYTIGGNFTFARQLDWQQYKPRFGNAWDEYRNSITERYAFLNWGLHAIGQFQNWEEIANYPIDNDRQGNTTLRPGDIKYEDTNGDKVINELDQRPIGYRRGGLPYLNFALNLGLQYKGFDFAVDFTGAGYASFMPGFEALSPFHDGGNNPQYYMGNQWRLSDITDPNSELIPGKYPTLIRGNQSHSNYWYSDFWMVNVNYIKLRNLEIGYSFPKSWVNKIGLQNLRVYSMMQNLFSIDNLGDMKIDPEITSDSNLQYPTNRVFNLGVNLVF